MATADSRPLSRERLKLLIKEGSVSVNGKKASKPSSALKNGPFFRFFRLIFYCMERQWREGGRKVCKKLRGRKEREKGEREKGEREKGEREWGERGEGRGRRERRKIVCMIAI
eukprot:972003-Amorphochlora_amoeboformis.AAC.1